MTEKKAIKGINLQFFSEKDEEKEEVVVEETSVIESEKDTKDGSETEDKPEKTKDDIPKEDPAGKEVELLTSELSEAQEKVASLSQELAEKTSEIDDLTSQLKTVSDSLETIVIEKSKNVPEDLMALMPENITATEKLDWLIKAETLKPKEEVKEESITAIGRPTPVTEEKVDSSKLSATQKMAYYFGQKK